MPASYFGQRLREQNAITAATDDDEIALLMAKLMDIPLGPASSPPTRASPLKEANVSDHTAAVTPEDVALV